MGPLRRSKIQVEDNIKMGINEIVYKGVDWIHLTEDAVRRWAVMNTVMKSGGPSISKKFLTSYPTDSLSRTVLLEI